MIRNVLVNNVWKQFYSSRRNRVNFDIVENATKELAKTVEIKPKSVKVNQSKEDGVIKRIIFFTLKCVIAGGVFYGSNEIGVWGPAQESAVLISQIEDFFCENSMKFIDIFKYEN